VPLRSVLPALQPVTISRIRARQNFDHDHAIELGIACAINLAHAYRANRRPNLVSAELGTGIEVHRVARIIARNRRPWHRSVQVTTADRVALPPNGQAGSWGREADLSLPIWLRCRSDWLDAHRDITDPTRQCMYEAAPYGTAIRRTSSPRSLAPQDLAIKSINSGKSAGVSTLVRLADVRQPSGLWRVLHAQWRVLHIQILGEHLN
jgi:hypothetical protein